MYLSPIIIFLIPWIFGSITTYYYSNNSAVFSDLSSTGIWYLSLLALFMFYSILIFNIQRRERVDIENIVKKKLNFNSLKQLVTLIVIAHFSIMILAIVYSSGFPLYWIFTNDTKTYAEYGIPTISGLGNMIRAFGLVGSLILYLYGTKAQKRTGLYSAIYFLFTAFFIELSRGNGSVMIAHAIGFYFLIKKISFKNTLSTALAILVFIPFFSFLQILRYGDFELERANEQLINVGIYDTSVSNLFLTPLILYTSTPIMNMDLNLQRAPDFKFSPDASIETLVPTFVRNIIYTRRDYINDCGDLISCAYNTTSFLTPLIKDFGRYGALFFAILILMISSFIYSKAREGSLYYILLWPPVFMSLIFSSFNMYFSSLVVVLYPLVISLSYNFLIKKQKSKFE